MAAVRDAIGGFFDFGPWCRLELLDADLLNDGALVARVMVCNPHEMGGAVIYGPLNLQLME